MHAKAEVVNEVLSTPSAASAIFALLVVNKPSVVNYLVNRRNKERV